MFEKSGPGNFPPFFKGGQGGFEPPDAEIPPGPPLKKGRDRFFKHLLGIRKGFEQGIQQGKQEGRREGLLEGIELALSVKFGKEGSELMPAIRTADTELLDAVKEAVRNSDDLKAIEALLK